MRAAPRYATEAELCADFIAEVRRTRKWECYPETEGWDILLVRLVDGFQIGVSAKLRLNAKVVAQALEQYVWNVSAPGPDCRAVLVSEGAGELGLLCAYIGIVVITLQSPPEKGYYARITPSLPDESRDTRPGRWPEWAPAKRHPLPAYVPDCAAGASAPVQLTAWKIAAIKIAVLLETRPVTRADFKHLGLDHRRWLPQECGWLRLTPDGYVAGAAIPDFRDQHPVNYEQIKADLAKWVPLPSLMPARQEGLL